MDEVILRMKNITKRFSYSFALTNVNFELRSGEVHALMGENGAGKSSLMKILCGMFQMDEGEIELFGKTVRFGNINESRSAGIGIIHQELNLIPDLTVAQNIYLGREPKKGIVIDDRKMSDDSSKLLNRLGIEINPDTVLGNLTVGHRQMVEIAKAISYDSKLLILDEPTAALSSSEVCELFKIMKDLSAKGIGMIFISHRMDEIMQIADRVTIMRDGEYIGTLKTSETSKDEIVKCMVGREVSIYKKERSNCPEEAPIFLEVKNLRRGDVIKDVSFSVRKGEILGFAGLMGSGRTEVARAVYGADRKEKGRIFINGKRVRIHSPSDAVKHGICYLSEDRARFGLLLGKSIAENTVLSSVDAFSSFGFLNDGKINDASVKINEKLNTKYSDISNPVKQLSGGNQQKVIIARWLLSDPDIYFFDEPTRGIDVGAKSEIYTLIEELAKRGKAVVVISSELAEIQRISDRVVVMCEGRKTTELDISEATQEKIMKYATAWGENENEK